MTDTPRKRRRIKNKTTILDVATSLIAEKSLENVSLRDIAKHADYSPAGLYIYFDSKAAIIEAVQDRENQKLRTLLQTVPSNLSPMQRLIELCLLYIDHCLQNKVYLILVNSLTSKRKSKDQSIPVSSPYKIFLEAVRTWVHVESITLQQNYGIEEVTYALWSLIHGIATLRSNQLKDFEADFDSVNRHSLEIFLKGIQK